MKRPPAWARPSKSDGELSARLAWPTPKRLAELSELSRDPRLSPETEAKVAGWIGEANPDAYTVAEAIEELRRRIGDVEGRQIDAFSSGDRAAERSTPAANRRRAQAYTPTAGKEDTMPERS